MSRLYLRIFLSFWLFVVLTIGAVLAFNAYLDRVQHDDTLEQEQIERLEETLAHNAQQALAENGRQGLIEWAEQPLRYAHTPALRQTFRRDDSGTARTPRRQIMRLNNLYVFDRAGEEILGRTPPSRMQRVARHWQQEGKPPQQSPRGLLLHTLADPDHGRFLIMLDRPSRPALTRILEPLNPTALITLAVLISGGICFWLARTITRPIRQLRDAGQALGQGRLETRIPTTSANRRDELGDLARGFNHMAERLERLVVVQRQLLRDVSHELRSPLARLQTALTLAGDSDDQATRTHYLERTDAEVERLNRLIDEILGYARLTEGVQPDFETLDLVDLIEDIAASARLEGAPRELRVEVDAPASVSVSADENLLHRAIENVVRNALRHAPQSSTIRLDLESDADTVTVAVLDDGPGVPDARLEDVFEPFVRLSTERGEAGEGGGIGLAIARAAVERHGGTIHAENRPQGGLVVRMRLPRAPVPA